MKAIVPGLLVSALLLSACFSGDPDMEHIIQQRAADQVAAIRANLLRDCQTNVLEDAQIRADSLLLERARRMRLVEGRPPKPARPGEPAVRPLSRPLPLRPLFPFEIRFDTLLRDSLLRDSLRIDSLQRNLLEDL